MRVLVTGGAGFLGSHLCEYLVGRGFEVAALDNFITGRKSNLANMDGNDQFQLIGRDVAHLEQKGAEFEIVFHLACPASPKDYQKHPIETMRTQSLGTFSTLELAKRCHSRYILASTSEIYGDPIVHPQTESYWGNVNPIGPRAPYDESKRFAEALSIAYSRKYGIDVRIARIFNTYGPRMRSDDGRVVPTFITQALRGESLTVFGDGRQTRSLCYVSDTIEGLFRLGTVDSLREKVLNIGAQDEVTMEDLARLIMKLCRTDAGITFCPLPEDDPKRRCPDISRAREQLGWEPRISMAEGLKLTIESLTDMLPPQDSPSSGDTVRAL